LKKNENRLYLAQLHLSSLALGEDILCAVPLDVHQ
jgi:hypothetical protein